MRRAAATLVQGTKVGEVYQAQQLFDVVSRSTGSAPESRRDSRAAVADRQRRTVPLGSVSTVDAPPRRTRLRARTLARIDVTSKVRVRDLGAVARDIEAQIVSLSFPQGTSRVMGEYAERQASANRLTLLDVIAVAAIFLILLAISDRRGLPR